MPGLGRSVYREAGRSSSERVTPTGHEKTGSKKRATTTQPVTHACGSAMHVLSTYVQTLGNEKQGCPSENQNQRLTPRRLHVDLNPVTAEIADVPETSEYTSVKQRVHHIKVEGRTSQLEAAKAGNVAGSLAAAGLEETLWLCPIEDRRRIGSSRVGFERG
jgi:hypothetical protein